MLMYFAFLVWKMKLNMKYSSRYSKTGMIHDNYIRNYLRNSTAYNGISDDVVRSLQVGMEPVKFHDSTTDSS